VEEQRVNVVLDFVKPSIGCNPAATVCGSPRRSPRSAACAVTIRRGGAPNDLKLEGVENMFKKILVPVDGSRTAAAGLREAIRLAQQNDGAVVRLLHVMEPLPAMQGMETLIEKQVIKNLRQFGDRVLKEAKAQVESAGVRAETALRRIATGRAAPAIVAEAARWKADAIVMGTHGRRGISRLVMGSDAEEVVRSAPAPVLLIRSDR
jgi:nucleotide-binding universal stress UspA family protein